MDIFDIQDAQDLFEQPHSEIVSNDLQRTPKWYKDREGKFTGSENYKLMGVSRAFAKMDWGAPEKITDFPETVKKYIFGKAKERQRKKVLKRSIGKNGEYGEIAEKLVKKILSEKYKIDEVGFVEFIPGIAGSSPDGLVDKKMNLEIKLAMGWDTLYLREQILFTEKHQDFWQINSEMLSLKVNKTMFVVAEPPEKLFDMKITDLSIQIVEASEIHQSALIHRCMIGNAAIELFLAGENFHEAIRKACTDYEFGDQFKKVEAITQAIEKKEPPKEIDFSDVPF